MLNARPKEARIHKTNLRNRITNGKVRFARMIDKGHVEERQPMSRCPHCGCLTAGYHSC